MNYQTLSFDLYNDIGKLELDVKFIKDLLAVYSTKDHPATINKITLSVRGGNQVHQQSVTINVPHE